jgi:hypothetical protein
VLTGIASGGTFAGPSATAHALQKSSKTSTAGLARRSAARAKIVKKVVVLQLIGHSSSIGAPAFSPNALRLKVLLQDEQKTKNHLKIEG